MLALRYRVFLAVSAATLLAGPGLAGPGAGASPGQEPDPLQVGAEAPDFQLTTLSGDTLRLSGLEGESPALVVFFRGAW